jgi:hypothetical protein
VLKRIGEATANCMLVLEETGKLFAGIAEKIEGLTSGFREKEVGQLPADLHDF